MKKVSLINSFKLILLLIITLHSFGFLYSQSLETDSLENILKSATIDEKIKILKDQAKKNFSTSPVKTIEYSKRVLELAQKTNNINEEATALRNIGTGYLTIGSSHEAIKYYQQSLNLYEKLENKQKISTLLSYIGMTYNDLGEYDKASKYLFESLKVAEEIMLEDASEEKRTNLKITIIDIYNSLGNVYSNLYKNDKALEYYNKTY